MSNLEIRLRRKAPVRGKKQRTTYLTLTGATQPYGEITVTVGTIPRQATVSADALPEAAISHPDEEQSGLIRIDDRTALTVGGITATLSKGRRGLSKQARALSVGLGERDYRYLNVGANTDELRRADGTPLVRTHAPIGFTTVLTVLPEADPTDLALALVLLGADTTSLTLTRTAVTGALSLMLGDGKGEA